MVDRDGRPEGLLLLEDAGRFREGADFLGLGQLFAAETEGDAMYANTRVFNEGRYAALEGFDAYEPLRVMIREVSEIAWPGE